MVLEKINLCVYGLLLEKKRKKIKLCLNLEYSHAILQNN